MAKDYKCKLPKFERYDCFTIQEAKQKSGWGITAFDLPKAWEFTQGEGVVIAVIDTGCDLDHPDLKDNLLEGYNFVKPGKTPDDDNGHGCVSPKCLVHTTFSGIDEIENLYEKIDKIPEIKQSKEGLYEVKNIENLNVKTYSLNIESQTTEVSKIISVQKLPIKGNVIKVTLKGNINYELTPWHPVYLLKNRHHNVYDVIRKRADEINIGDKFIFADGEKAGNLTEEDGCVHMPMRPICVNCGHEPKYWVNDQPTQCKKCNRKKWVFESKELIISESLAYLAGICLTDGHISKDRVEISSNTPEILSKIKSICDGMAWTSVVESKRILIYGRSAIDSILALGIQSGKKSLTQKLPEWVGCTNYKNICAFIAGVIDGDGCISKENTRNRITTASYDFAKKMCALMNSIGVSCGVSNPEFDKRKNRAIKSKFSVFKITHSALPMKVVENMAHPIKIERSKLVLCHRYRSRSVKSVEIKKYKGFFYDFTVEKYHNYLAEGHYVSNTHVTGILVAENNDIGMVGVCPKAKVRPIKALDAKGNGNLTKVAMAIKWAVDNGCDIITMSLGAPLKVQQVRKAIQYAAERGIPTFVAAGNVGLTKEVFYPAAYPESIAIGAIDENFKRADFSNTGSELDFMAPGVDIFSTVPDDWYATLSGTSMACPFAVGVAALVLSYVKSGKATYSLKTVQDYKDIFKRYTTPVTNGNYKDPQFYQGFGIIDPRKFMEGTSQVH